MKIKFLTLMGVIAILSVHQINAMLADSNTNIHAIQERKTHLELLF